ncbi:TadE/TadG family type IV pilus assembly protein [Vibrio profundi]|uniref:TadE/TadG family type IV pilus assembly protein n=1 Tax=Vibrio profundi TaxID=1774960 RepID=UPI0037366DCE
MNGSMKNQKGLAAIEFALAMPAMMIVLAGVLEVGNIFMQYNSLTRVVQAGARFAVTESFGTAGVECTDIQGKQASIQNVVVYGKATGGSDAALDSFTLSDVSVSCDDDARVATVTADYDYSPKLAPSIPFTNTSFSFTLSASSVMRY